MKPLEIRDPLASRIQHQIALPVLRRSASLRRKIANAADISDFIDWQVANFETIKPVRTKSLLWKKMADRMRELGGPWHGMEFGVAYGHATSWWLTHLDEKVIATWDGFDRFSGLPRPWRGYPTGAFDADGQTPEIDDARVSWHVGNLEDTIVKMDSARISSDSRLIYFDLDIYEPSKLAWDWVYPHLRHGDILYFDEAYDSDERRLLNEAIIPMGSYNLIGATATNLAIEVSSVK